MQHRGFGVSSWESLGFIESRASGGTATQPKSYGFPTEVLRGGTHTFHLRQVDTDGSATLTEPWTLTIQGQAGLQVSGANPIAWGHSVPVVVQVEVRQSLTMVLYDALGRRVRTVEKGEIHPGQPLRVQRSTMNLPSGVYFLRARGELLEETHQTIVAL